MGAMLWGGPVLRGTPIAAGCQAGVMLLQGEMLAPSREWDGIAPSPARCSPSPMGSLPFGWEPQQRSAQPSGSGSWWL